MILVKRVFSCARKCARMNGEDDLSSGKREIKCWRRDSNPHGRETTGF